MKGGEKSKTQGWSKRSERPGEAGPTLARLELTQKLTFIQAVKVIITVNRQTSFFFNCNDRTALKIKDCECTTNQEVVNSIAGWLRVGRNGGMRQFW